MNEEQAKEIMRKVLQADRIITEQQLGLHWQPPSEDFFRNVDPHFFQENVNDQGIQIQDAQEAFEDTLDDGYRIKSQMETSHRESLAAKFNDHKSNSKTMKRALELLCNEAGFLVFCLLTLG